MSHGLWNDMSTSVIPPSCDVFFFFFPRGRLQDTYLLIFCYLFWPWFGDWFSNGPFLEHFVGLGQYIANIKKKIEAKDKAIKKIEAKDKAIL